MTGRQSAVMDLAQLYVTKKGWKPAQAAAFTGISVATIYRSAWYKAHRAAQKAAQQ